MTKGLVKLLRLALLLVILLLSLIAYYFYSHRSVRIQTVQFESRLMKRALPYNVILPPGYDLITERKTRYPVIYLLHGWSGSYSSWLASSSLAEYAEAHQLIIVMPEGGNGWYTDSATTESDKYESYIIQELIPEVDNRFRTIRARGGRAVAGYSMGGYGALKFAFKYPEQFAFAASMSGAFDAASRTDDASIMQAFGPTGSPTRASNDLQKLAREYPAERFSLLPYLYLDCGTEDPWLASNREMATIFLERGIVHEYRQLHGGHGWPYWNNQLREILKLASESTLHPQS